MAATKWKKSPEALVTRFEEVVSRKPGIERRPMFGYPCAFLNGHMLCGLYQDDFILRLPEAARTKFLKQAGTKLFEPMPGRPMKEYVLVPKALLGRDASFEPWLREAVDYVAAMPPKQKPAKKAPKKKVAKKKDATTR